MTNDEQKDVLRHWIGEANNAIIDIAFVRLFQELSAKHSTCAGSSQQVYDLGYHPIGRVISRRVFSTADSLILFCAKSSDKHSRVCNVFDLKEAIFQGRSASFLASAKPIEKAFKDYEINAKPHLDNIKSIRNKLVAHSEKAVILGSRTLMVELDILLSYSEHIISLISSLADHSGFKVPGTVQHPARSDNSLVLHQKKSAEQDAEIFWGEVFKLLTIS